MQPRKKFRKDRRAIARALTAPARPAKATFKFLIDLVR